MTPAFKIKTSILSVTVAAHALTEAKSVKSKSSYLMFFPPSSATSAAPFSGVRAVIVTPPACHAGALPAAL